METGNGVMHNGTTTVDDYGQNLDKLKVSSVVNYLQGDLSFKSSFKFLLFLGSFLGTGYHWYRVPPSWVLVPVKVKVPRKKNAR
jgi:hypothetical protein